MEIPKSYIGPASRGRLVQFKILEFPGAEARNLAEEGKEKIAQLRHREESESTIEREVEEEIGYAVQGYQHITTCYLSPGGSSERIHIYYVEVDSQNKRSAGGGVAGEGEDIRNVELPRAAAFEKIANGEIVDAKTVIALQWLQLNPPGRSSE